MSRRKRNVTIVAVVLALVMVELAYQFHRPHRACVVVRNDSIEPIEGLTLACGNSSTGINRIRPGESAKLYLNGNVNQVLVLNYSHKGSALQGFQIPGFNLADISRAGARLVVIIRSNEFERYQEDDDPSGLSRAGTGFVEWLESSLQMP